MTQHNTRMFWAQEDRWITNRSRAASINLSSAIHHKPGGGRENGVALFMGTKLVLCLNATEAAALADSLIDSLEAHQSPDLAEN
ncbi:hypothetical protein ACTXOR_02330 [Arthrobacter rhombi]|uniref:hypothetical protein n=1 Tax=Arthrobacter rhombi TaxID=71253 RepID=UPI003FD0059E